MSKKLKETTPAVAMMLLELETKVRCLCAKEADRNNASSRRGALKESTMSVHQRS